ncbi:hypothetical protein A2691_00590 [Candidatus Woesebacteria bacterium RIFCSPHIGHO2_01_FULL_39_23]|nr:MAG: hypothetical protein A2691_00590 [Candidatus Woesebacteria bacterium RIFCSPHIGHO2_01_FULL_39_23]
MLQYQTQALLPVVNLNQAVRVRIREGQITVRVTRMVIAQEVRLLILEMQPIARQFQLLQTAIVPQSEVKEILGRAW